MNTETNLIAACRRGDRVAQLTLYEKYAPRLYPACLRITGSAEDAEEALQDAFLKAFSHLRTFAGAENFGAWLHKIALRTAIDYTRRQEPAWESLDEKDDFLDENGGSLAEEEGLHYAVEQVKAALSLLPAGYRSVLSLYLFEGYDSEEIASILGIREESVRSQYLRAKRRLIVEMQKKKGI
ncbi:MAG: RNA polymerase sigma factor [Tannerella sp.]|jgi:RNA polymerase sigma-70 factor (ECF subfamily)|nr:RNA polymerase sigma factor [Tannerella sp.]